MNIPYELFFNSEDGTLIEETKMKNVFKNVKLDKPIIFTCGAAVTACVADLCLRIMGKEDSKLYDGSWAEYS